MRPNPGLVALLLASFASCAFASDASFPDILRAPDAVTVVTEAGSSQMAKNGEAFKSGTVVLETKKFDEGLAVTVAAPGAALKTLTLRWNAKRPVAG